MNRFVHAAGRGALAGLAATTTMSASMLAFQELGLMGRMPPRLITERMLDFMGIRRKTPRRARKALATLLHFAFGGVGGMIFEVAREAFGKRVPRALALPYALGIYATSYAGWVPAIGAVPPPKLDRPGRQPAMVAAHLVFGATLALFAPRRTRRTEPARAEEPLRIDVNPGVFEETLCP